MSLSGAIHLCTGQPDEAARIDRWLTAHDVPIEHVEDPFRLCVLMLRQPELAPDMALLGGSGLTGDDWAVLHYLKETWPHIGIIAYGGPELKVPEPRLLTCRTEIEWQHILAGTPKALLNAIRHPLGLPRTKTALDVSAGVPAPGEPLDGALTAEELADLLERYNDA